MILSFFIHIAHIGFILSLLTHAATFQKMNFQEEIPIVWLLHFGIFFVWIPTVLLMIQMAKLTSFKDLSSTIGRHTPVWMWWILGALSAYAAFHFYGVLTVAERVSANEDLLVQKYSAHWSLFYFLSFLLLQAVKKHLEYREEVS